MNNTPQLRFPGFTGEWSEKPLSDFLFEHKTKSDGKCEVHSVSVTKGVINQVEYLGRSFAAKDTSKYNLVKPNDIIYTKSPTGDFPYGIVKMNKLPYNVIVSPLYAVYSPINKHIGYILDSYFESSVNTNNYLSSLVQKGAKNTINITNDTFVSKMVCLPTDPAEQQKIAECLSALDDLISAQGEKVDALKTRKKGLMQQLFPQNGETTPRLRFPGFTGEWSERTFGEIYEKHNVKNDGSIGVDKIISVANMYFKSDAVVGDAEYLKSYNVFRLGDIAYEGNKSANHAYGRFVENTIGDGIVSHVFDVYSPISPDHCNEYWKYAINYERIMRPILEKSTIKSTMMTNLIAKDFLKQKTLVPSPAEQQKIASCLSALDDLIASESAELEALKAHKKGLMQQLFPEPAK